MLRCDMMIKCNTGNPATQFYAPACPCCGVASSVLLEYVHDATYEAPCSCELCQYVGLVKIPNSISIANARCPMCQSTCSLKYMPPAVAIADHFDRAATLESIQVRDFALPNRNNDSIRWPPLTGQITSEPLWGSVRHGINPAITPETLPNPAAGSALAQSILEEVWPSAAARREAAAEHVQRAFNAWRPSQPSPASTYAPTMPPPPTPATERLTAQDIRAAAMQYSGMMSRDSLLRLLDNADTTAGTTGATLTVPIENNENLNLDAATLR